MLTFRTRNSLQFNLENLGIGKTAKVVGSPIDGSIVYRAAQSWLVNLSNPKREWPDSTHMFAKQILFDATITRMPIALWTEPDEFVSTENMSVGDFGIICDEGQWHSAFILKAPEGLVHLSNSGSRISRWTTIKKVMPVDMTFTENTPNI